MKKERKISHKKPKITKKLRPIIRINRLKIPLKVLEEYYKKESKIKKFLKIILFLALEIFVIILIIYFSVFLYRTISSRQIDDVNPYIQCNKDLLAKAKIYYVIPKFKNISIADEPEWCKYVRSLNKTLYMHGVTHEYSEFKYDRDEAYVKEGMDIFEKCFGFKPKAFRPPQLEINKHNKELIKQMGMRLDLFESTNLHKDYHCNDTGIEKNARVEII